MFEELQLAWTCLDANYYLIIEALQNTRTIWRRLSEFQPVLEMAEFMGNLPALKSD